MNEAAQFLVILGSILVLVLGTIGVPLILGLLGAARLRAFEQRLAQVEQRVDERIAEMEERIDFAERIVTQARERGELPGPTSPAREAD